MSVIKLKFSDSSAQPVADALVHAEPAYSFVSGKLFIGKYDGSTFTNAVPVGGEFFTSMLDHTAGVNTASSALIVDAYKHIDDIITGGLTLTASNGAGQRVTSIITDINGSVSHAQLATASAIKSYIDSSVGATSLSEQDDVSITSVVNANFLIYDTASGLWKNRALSGDATANSSGVITLKNSGVVAGAYGNSSNIPTFTVDAQGRVTAASQVSVSSTLTIGGDVGSDDTVNLLTGKLTVAGGVGLTSTISDDTITVKLDDTAVTPGAYGDTSSIPVFTVDAQGRITAASEVTISTSIALSSDSGTDSVDLLSETLAISGGTGIETSIVASSGEVVVKLSNTAVSSGGYGSATLIPVLSIDAQGRITAASSTAVSVNTSFAGDTGSGDVGTGSTLTVAGGTGLTTAFAAGTLTVTLDDTTTAQSSIGSATTIPVISVNAQGQITALTTTSINANSFGTITVSDTDTGFSWAETGNTVAAANAAALTFVSGYGVNVDVDSTSDAVRFTNTGVTAVAVGTYLSVDQSTGDITVSTNATDANTASTLVARDANGDFAAGKITANEVQVDDVNINGNVISTTTTDTNLQLTPNGTGQVEVTSDLDVAGNLVVTGDLTVSGTTTTINTTTLEVTDPIIHLASGNDTSDTVDIGFVGHYSEDAGATLVHTGFVRHAADGAYYLFDGYSKPSLDAGGNLIDPTDATFNLATLRANIVGTITGNAESASKLLDARTIELTGDVTGTVSFDGSANVQISTTIQPNSVVLGADTTGNYVETLASANGGLTITNSGTESAAVVIELDVADGTFIEGAQDAAGAMITNGTFTNMTMTYDDANNVINGSIANATTSVKGVASFSSTNFTVTNGVVTITEINGGTF
jgi:hypothetical protein